jgi:hypothetical protein
MAQITSDLLIISQVNVSQLLLADYLKNDLKRNAERQQPISNLYLILSTTAGGAFVNVGKHLDRISLEPGSGKVMMSKFRGLVGRCHILPPRYLA